MTIMAIDVKEEQDGSFTISWDENDPLESMFNTWTEQDFIDCIMKRCNELLGQSQECPPTVDEEPTQVVISESPTNAEDETLSSGS